MERSTPNTPARTNSTIPTLLTLFFLWKSLLLLLAAASPGPGYDTSTDVLFATSTTTHDAPTDSLLGRLVARLTRWDAVYFTASSLRGHVFEQESAFSAYVARQSARVARGASAP
jgi:phosphatidylinositol glycan class V